MYKDKKILYSISLITFAVLLSALFVGVKNSKILAACLLIPLTALTCLLIKKRRSVSINKKEVLFFSTIVGVLYIVLVQMTGIFFEFYKNPYFVNSRAVLSTIIPLTAIIVSTEIFRYVMLAQNNKFASVMTFLSCLTAEILMFSNFSGITSFNRFMDLVGLTLFPAISANIYYHYVSKKFGALPNISFRLITTLYIYFVPTVSGMADALVSCAEIFIPIIMLTLVTLLFEKKKKNAIRKGQKLSFLAMVLTVVFVISLTMLISCQFRFGAIVIATESMTGEINKGDMIIYEKYDDQTIKEGQVIVYYQNEDKIIHRVVRIENIGNETRYYTKGDSNPSDDPGYRTEKDIFALTEFKVPYVGYPTLWLRELLKGSY